MHVLHSFVTWTDTWTEAGTHDSITAPWLQPHKPFSTQSSWAKERNTITRFFILYVVYDSEVPSVFPSRLLWVNFRQTDPLWTGQTAAVPHWWSIQTWYKDVPESFSVTPDLYVHTEAVLFWKNKVCSVSEQNSPKGITTFIYEFCLLKLGLNLKSGLNQDKTRTT